jgi:hypothetical protein
VVAPLNNGANSSGSQRMAFTPDGISAPPFARSARDGKKVSGDRVHTH